MGAKKDQAASRSPTEAMPRTGSEGVPLAAGSAAISASLLGGRLRPVEARHVVDDGLELLVLVALDHLHHVGVRIAAPQRGDVADLAQHVLVVVAREHRVELLLAALPLLAVALNAVAPVQLLAHREVGA